MSGELAPNNILQSLEQAPAFNEHTFNKMSYVLTSEQIEVLKTMKDNLRIHKETTQMFRSEVEMRFSVLTDTKFPTPDAKYWQACREQDVHYTNLVMLSFDFEAGEVKRKNLQDLMRKYEIQQKILRQKIAVELDILAQEEFEIERDILQNKIDTLAVEVCRTSFIQEERKKEASNRWREVVTWEKICMELVPQMKYGILSYEHHQPKSYGIRMEKQEKIMLNSGAKGSPSEAINITSQNTMIKKLTSEGVLKPDPRELPIDRAVREVVSTIKGGRNYIQQQGALLDHTKDNIAPERLSNGSETADQKKV